MTEGYGLSALKVSVPRHYHGCIGTRDSAEQGHERAEKLGYFADLAAKVKTDVKRDLIVSAARGVQPLSRVADTLCQLGFDEHVYILAAAREIKLSRIKIVEYVSEGGNDCVCVLL